MVVDTAGASIMEVTVRDVEGVALLLKARTMAKAEKKVKEMREGVDVVEVDIVDVVAGAVDSAVVGVDVGDSDGVHQRESIRRMLPAMESRHRRKPTLKMERVDEVVVGVVEVAVGVAVDVGVKVRKTKVKQLPLE